VDPHHPLRRAQWIWPCAYEELHNGYAQFRRDFELKRVPKRAPFFITADARYMLYVNGRYVARGPARGYQVSWPYDEVDLAPYLVRGHNWISVVAYNPGISTFQYIHQTAAGLLCAGKWGDVEILSGAGWLMRVDPAHARQTARLSIQISFQEHVDARLDDRSWITSPRPPKDWAKCGGGRAFGSMPWHGVEPRGIPHLTSDVLPYTETWFAASGPCADGFESWTNLTYGGFYTEAKDAKWTPGPRSRVTPDGLAFTLPATGPNRFAAVSMDRARLTFGTLCVEATGAAGGEIIDFFACEALNPDGSPVMCGPGGACGASMSMRLRLKAGRTRYEFFQPLGHAYLVAIARDTRRPIRLKLACRHTVYPFDIRGSFETSDPVLNEIYRISVDTQRVCALDSYVDTPWREQAQWWGDARVQAQNTFHISGDPRLLVRGIRSIAAQEVPNGLTYGHAPTIAHGCVLPDFSMIWALTIWDYYYQTGDLSIFEEQWPRIERLLDYFTGEGRGPDGLLRYDERYWLFLDWCDIHKAGTPTLLNLWYLLMLEKLGAMAGAARMKPEQKRLLALHRAQKRLILAKLWDADAGLFRDGIAPDGQPVPVHSIHTQTLAILCGLRLGKHKSMAEKILLPYLRDEKVPGAQPSSYWVTYVYGVMRQLGYGREVVEHIRGHWAPMIPYGGTWEIFDEKAIGNSSTSHAWAAHPIYHLTGALGGVTQSDVAWRRIAFAPVLDVPGVDRCSIVVPTPNGFIRAGWKRRGNAIAVSLSLPEGVQADVRLPGMDPARAASTSRWLVKDQG
jgi:hypothetical protein